MRVAIIAAALIIVTYGCRAKRDSVTVETDNTGLTIRAMRIDSVDVAMPREMVETVVDDDSSEVETSVARSIVWRTVDGKLKHRIENRDTTLRTTVITTHDTVRVERRELMSPPALKCENHTARDILFGAAVALLIVAWMSRRRNQSAS